VRLVTRRANHAKDERSGTAPASETQGSTAAADAEGGKAAGSEERTRVSETESRKGRRGGRTFAAVTSLPPLLLMAWLLPGIPLLLVHRFTPQPMALIAVPLAVALIMLYVWSAPVTWAVLGPVTQAGKKGTHSAAAKRSWGTWGGLAGTTAIAAGFTVWQLLVNSAQFFTDREPGAYLQVGYWIAEHGLLPIPASLAPFGGAHHGLTLASFGFTSHAGAVVPRLTAELPIVLAAGLWAHGLPGVVWVPPVLGGLAVLSVGGLTGRLAGPHWAPAGALLAALTVPQVYVGRSAFSETLTQALVFGGLCLVVDAVSSGKPAAPATLGGVALGLAAGVGASTLIMLAPVIVFAGVLVAGRRREALPFVGGVVVGAALGVAGAVVLSFPLLGSGAPPLGVMEIVGGVFVGLAVVGAAVGLVPPARRAAGWLLTRRPLRWLPDVAGVAVAGLVIALAVRPYVQTARGGPDPYVAYLQRLAGLPVDPGRLYAEKSLYWLVWYLGVPALLLGVIGLALATRLCLRALFTWRDPSGTARAWALPAALAGWALFAVLWQPYTEPDQPWASRRLVPVVLPGLVVLAVWVSARLTARARALGAGSVSVAVAAVCFVAAVAVPPAAITFGLRPLRATTPEVKAALSGVALRRTGIGEYGAVRSLCGSIPGNGTAVMLDAIAAREFTQVVRGMCGVPAAVMVVPGGKPAGPGGVLAVPASAAGGPGSTLHTASPADVEAVISGILRSGRRPVLLATAAAELTPYGAQARQVVNLQGDQDAHVIDRPPTSAWPVRYALWMSQPGGTPFGS
jgi:hypothetical protein